MYAIFTKKVQFILVREFMNSFQFCSHYFNSLICFERIMDTKRTNHYENKYNMAKLIDLFTIYDILEEYASELASSYDSYEKYWLKYNVKRIIEIRGRK